MRNVNLTEGPFHIFKYFKVCSLNIQNIYVEDRVFCLKIILEFNKNYKNHVEYIEKL